MTLRPYTHKKLEQMVMNSLTEHFKFQVTGVKEEIKKLSVEVSVP